MKKSFISALFLGILTLSTLGLSGCTQTEPPTNPDPINPPTDLLEEIRQRGEIVIATEGTWAPWTYHDEADALVGFDVEIAKKVAEKLGVSPRFVEAKWDGIFAGLDAKRYDLAANGVEITEERGEKYDFSDPYAYIRTVIIVNGDNSDIHAFEDLKGKRTANTLASTYGILAEGYGAEAIGVDDLNQTMEMLLTNRVDATLNAEVSFYDYMKAHPKANLKIVAQTDDAAHVAFPIRKGADTETLRIAVNHAIAELHAAGDIATLSNQYFGSDISKGE